MEKASTCLWFATQAEEAAAFYISVFRDSRIKRVLRGNGGAAISVEFELAGSPFMALNGNPNETFNESVSVMMYCNMQEEIDEYWNKLTADGGAESMCGWLSDKFGVSWQIVPEGLVDMITDADKEKAGRTMQAMMKMRKLVIADLVKAYEGK